LGLLLTQHYIKDDFPSEPQRLDWPGFLLSGICLSTLVSGLEAIGHRSLPASQLLALIGVGLICGVLYVRHARRAPYPIIDLALLRTPTFAIATLGGNLCRFSIGAAPFLLAILLQVGFNLTPFSAGMITFTGAIGAIAMKLVTSPII